MTASSGSADLSSWRQTLQDLKANIASVIRGKDEVIARVLTSLFAGGHLLIEDVPGVGKTTLAQAVAISLGCSFRRIQFTADMLPADLIGVSIYNQKTESFEFRRGPLFSQVILADEINRTSPRTQSALLEAMNERQITVDGQTHALEHPFLVLATQNPIESFGTYPLPDSQYDRFLMRIRIGYPPPEVEREVLRTRTRHEPVESLESSIDRDTLLALQHKVDDIQFDEGLQDYLYSIVAETRVSSLLSTGVSTRGSLQFHRAVRAFAMVQERDYVLPDDIKALAPICLAHRVTPKQRVGSGGWSADKPTDTEQVILEIMERIAVPL